MIVSSDNDHSNIHIESLILFTKVQVGKDQEKAQSERDSQKPRWEKTKLTISHLYHETYRKPNEQLFSQ